MKKAIFFTISLLFSLLSHAGEQTGTIQYLRVRASDGLIYFALTGTAKTSSPACATRGYWMIRDEKSGAGKQQYAMLLAAQLTGKSVVVSGLNTCSRWPDGEDVNDIYIMN